MNIINKKSNETPENYFYGVNVNDKDSVYKEYNQLRKKHRNVTILVIIVLFFLAFIVFDFWRVNFANGKPLFAIESSVERGTLFKGIGYSVLYCDNGERYLGSVLYKTCDEIDERTFTNIVYEKLFNYSVEKKKLDRENLDKLTISSLTYDEDNDKGGSDYLTEITFACKDKSDKCFKTSKEFNDAFNVKIYIRLNKYNEIYDIITFKNTGLYYDELKSIYTDRIKQYLITNGSLNEENLRLFNINLVSNYGKYKFRGNIYADSYLVNISYSCLDNSNTCVKAIGDEDLYGDYSNQNFYMSMFLDGDDNVLLMGPREYFDI